MRGIFSQAWDLRTGNHLTMDDEIDPWPTLLELMTQQRWTDLPAETDSTEVFMRFHFHFLQDRCWTAAQLKNGETMAWQCSLAQHGFAWFGAELLPGQSCDAGTGGWRSPSFAKPLGTEEMNCFLQFLEDQGLA